MFALYHIQDKQYKALFERLSQREELVFGNTAGPEVDLEDVGSSRLPQTKVSLER